MPSTSKTNLRDIFSITNTTKLKKINKTKAGCVQLDGILDLAKLQKQNLKRLRLRSFGGGGIVQRTFGFRGKVQKTHFHHHENLSKRFWILKNKAGQLSQGQVLSRQMSLAQSSIIAVDLTKLLFNHLVSDQ